MAANIGDQYGLPEDKVERLKQQAVKRAEARSYVQRMMSDPHRHGHGGYLFDPAMQRYHSMMATQYDHFRPTPKTTRFGLMYFVIPCFLYGWMVHRERSTREHKIRTGQIAYKDRNFKFV